MHSNTIYKRHAPNEACLCLYCSIKQGGFKKDDALNGMFFSRFCGIIRILRSTSRCMIIQPLAYNSLIICSVKVPYDQSYRTCRDCRNRRRGALLHVPLTPYTSCSSNANTRPLRVRQVPGGFVEARRNPRPSRPARIMGRKPASANYTSNNSTPLVTLGAIARRQCVSIATYRCMCHTTPTCHIRRNTASTMASPRPAATNTRI
jgi:hypothetical protein